MGNNLASNFVVALVTVVAVIVLGRIYSMIRGLWARVTAVGRPQTITLTTARTPWQILVDGCRSLLMLIFMIIFILLAISLFGAASVFGWEKIIAFFMSVTQLQ